MVALKERCRSHHGVFKAIMLAYCIVMFSPHVANAFSSKALQTERPSTISQKFTCPSAKSATYRTPLFHSSKLTKCHAASSGEPSLEPSTQKNRWTRAVASVPSKSRNIMQSVISKTQIKLRAFLLWQRRHQRNTMVAAMVAFSLFTSSSQENLAGSNEMQQGLQSKSSPIGKVMSSSSKTPNTVQLQHDQLRVSGGASSRIGGSSSVLKRAVQGTVRSTGSGEGVRSKLVSKTGGGVSQAGPHKWMQKQNSQQKVTPMPMAAAGLSSKSVQTSAFEETVISASTVTKTTLRQAFLDLFDFMKGPKSDTLLLLLATALITPLCQRLGTSPILGFLASGMLLGPNGFGLISGIHTTETLAELGIVFFLFEMGIELSFDRLKSMKKDVFGLGMSQFVCTALAIAGVGSLFGLPANALVVLGGGLALSSSAFVLQLLKDKDKLATRFGKASFGVLLFQDLAVVPLLVVTPILAGGGSGMAIAIFSAVVKAGLALGSIAFLGRVVLNPLFKTVAEANSQEAFLGVILLTVLSMSFMTEGLGLSNTLGAFLAGVLLSETKYRYQIEADIAPFRGILLGLFFVTVGFEIDVGLIASNLPLVSSIVFGTVAIKAIITTLLCLASGLSLSTSQQTGLILSQGGEFAFVAFGLARGLGILEPAFTKLMLTSVSLTMAITPFLYDAGVKIAKRLEEKSDFTHYLGQDSEAKEIAESDEFAVVVGYGAVGKVVCDLLDRKFYKYVGIEVDPNKAIEARNKGLPVFFGDIGRPEVAEAFNVGSAKAVIVTIADKAEANRAVISLRREYPNLKIFARAKDADHASRLQNTLDVVAMVPIMPEDNVLMTLPFGGAVLKSLGAEPSEVNAILEAKRKEVLQGRGLAVNEEETVLTQLGIITEETRQAKLATEAEGVIEVQVSSDAQEDKYEKEHDNLSTAAAAALAKAQEKNPMVAQAISSNVPDCVDRICDADELELIETNENTTSSEETPVGGSGL
uniref:RCK N-terminal domain-containing protein n=1 Tax=Attheya septentrionalis TaxID=420275 RepID=A0A7S2XSK7_9STRA|mmetsp:Transcript_7873/g.14181  ORF Transcript_7873/g.14181 Transcript_7873/m.14181 type:complete len:983 (+) Transcript_7873:174-3122(+)